MPAVLERCRGWTSEGENATEKRSETKGESLAARNFSVLMVSQREINSHSHTLFSFRQIFVHTWKEKHLQNVSENWWTHHRTRDDTWKDEMRRAERRTEKQKEGKKLNASRSSMCAAYYIVFLFYNRINFVLTCRNATVIICLWRWKHHSSKRICHGIDWDMNHETNINTAGDCHSWLPNQVLNRLYDFIRYLFLLILRLRSSHFGCAKR